MSSENEKVFFKPYFFVLGVIGAFLLLISSMIVANSDEPETAAPTAKTAPAKASEENVVASPVDERTAPVGQVDVAAAAGAEGDAPAVEVSIGQKTYDAVCTACHGMGIAGAPKFGDKKAWTARLEQGNDVLYDHAINGFMGSAGMMPAKGGRADIADEDIKAAVDYMLEAVGASGSAPAAEEAPAPAPAVPVVEAAEVVEEVQVVETATEEVAEAADSTEAVTAEVAEEVTEAAPAVAAVADGKGKEVYDQACFLCHTPGAAGAPKFGDKDVWAPRIAKGKETLYTHALKGFMGKAGMMPAKGGRADIADEDIQAAVDYMIANSQ